MCSRRVALSLSQGCVRPAVAGARGLGDIATVWQRALFASEPAESLVLRRADPLSVFLLPAVDARSTHTRTPVFTWPLCSSLTA